MEYVRAILVLGGLLGGLSAVLLLLQRVLLPVRPCTIDVNDGRRVLEVETRQTLLEALYNAEIFIPSGCGGTAVCGACTATVLSGGGPVLPTESPHLTPDQIARSVRLACCVRLRGDVCARIDPAWFDVRRYKARVAAARMLTRDTREIRIELADPPSFAHGPGQYVQVEAPAADGLAPRAYSISSAAGRVERFEIVVKLVPGGAGSTYLHSVRPGDTVWFTGPYGDFRLLEDPGGRLVCVAGGCGLGAVKGIVETVLERTPRRPVRVFAGVRTSDDAFYRDHFERLAARHRNLEVIYACSQARRGAPSGPGDAGMIHEVVQRRLAPGEAQQAYICGPPPMVDATAAVLRQKGLPPHAIHADAYG